MKRKVAEGNSEYTNWMKRISLPIIMANKSACCSCSNICSEGV